MAKTSPKPRTGKEVSRSKAKTSQASQAQAEQRARDDALRSQDSPKPHGDPLLDVINPLRHVAKDLT